MKDEPVKNWLGRLIAKWRPPNPLLGVGGATEVAKMATTAWAMSLGASVNSSPCLPVTGLQREQGMACSLFKHQPGGQGCL